MCCQQPELPVTGPDIQTIQKAYLHPRDKSNSSIWCGTNHLLQHTKVCDPRGEAWIDLLQHIKLLNAGVTLAHKDTKACFSPVRHESLSREFGKLRLCVHLLCVCLSTCRLEDTWEVNVTRTRPAWIKHTHIYTRLEAKEGSLLCQETHFSSVTHTHTEAWRKTMTLSLNQQTETVAGCWTAFVPF